MTATALAPAPPPVIRTTDVSEPASRSSGWRVLAAATTLFFIYFALSAVLTDHRGSLGSDTGGKIAALERMHASDDLSPDLGYWAEHDDPDGSLYPIFFSGRSDAGWITTSTLPMLYAAYPLYALGGMQAALIIPMLAAVAVALAARALATRLGGPPWATFWLVGVATPLAVYALDFWEHAVGVAAMMWAIVLLDDVVHGRAGWRAAGGAGALFGLAATMRTEAFVYAAVAAVVVGVVICRRRSLRDLVKLAMAGALGGVVVLGANAALERVVLGSSIRTGRAAATAGVAGGDGTERLRAAGTTLLGLNHWPDPLDIIIGAVVVVLVGYGAWRLSRPGSMSRKVGASALGVAAFLYAVRFQSGWGFVPGVLTACPLAIAGFLAVRTPRARPWLIVALATMPLVWFSQHADGLRPQWGGRYLLMSSLLLAIVGLTWLVPRGGARAARATAFVAVAAMSVAVTASGVLWLAERSHTLADGMEELVARNDGAVISRNAHLFREGGAFYSPEKRWLTATSEGELREAVQIVERAEVQDFALVTQDDQAVPRRLGDYRRGASESIETLPSTVMTVTTYRR